jgi:hypothetical protein
MMEGREQTQDKNYLKEMIIVSVITTVAGLIMALNSVHFGMSAAELWLMKRGGSDTGLYHIIVNSNIQKFLVTGSILFVLGLLSSIVGIYIAVFNRQCRSNYTNKT